MLILIFIYVHYFFCFFMFLFFIFNVFIVVYLVIQGQVMQMLLLRILFSSERSRGTEIQCNLGVNDNEVNY